MPPSSIQHGRLAAFAPHCASLARCSVSSHRSRLFRPRTRLWRRAGTARHISGLRPPNCLGLVGLWPPSRRRGVPALRTPFGRGHNSAWSFRIARKLACGSPLCPQFAIVALLRYRLQVSFAHWTSASPVSRTARGEAPSPLGLLRAASPTGRALRAPLAPPAALRPSIAHCARPPCAPRPSTPSGLRRLRPVSRTARGLRAPPLHKGGSGVVLLPAAYH